ITLYPVFADKQQVEDPPTTDEFTITFDLGDYGTTDDETEVTTVNGKITAFPRVKPETGYRFDCWMMGNKEVDESTVFTDDATVYAQYDDSDEVESDGELLVNGQRKLYLTDNTENIQAPIEGNTATYEYMATGVELSPGEVVTFRIKGKVLVDHPNAADGDRLWDTDKRHGVTFNQATGEFKVKSNAGSSFNIYVRYYNTGTDAAHPCWSIEFTDGEPDELVDGGLYLVGSGFENAQWGPTPELYIDPDEGLLITFSSGNQIKACHCDGENAVWDMGEPAKYKEVGGNNIDFSTVDADYGNANVTGSGTYTYKVTVENGIVVFTLVA
ncbi:MAG: hypothetical protein K2O04_07685, partial [Clostridiales bacterium]|nr:hypothetical protein [Clostridiales bacterium]